MFIAVSRSHVTKAQVDDWQIICACAVSQLEEVCSRICSGDILVHELQKISDKQLQMSKLCIAAATPPEQHKGREAAQIESNTITPSTVPCHDVIKACIDTKLKELHFFTTYRDQLSHFLHLTSSLPLTGKTVPRFMLFCNCIY